MRTPDTLQPSVSDPVYSIPMSTQSPIDNNVGEATRLTITMKVEVPSRKKIVYRAIQRRDGVIVEKPRYRPSSPEASTSNDGRSAVVSKISTITSKRDTITTQPDWMGRMDEHLAGIGAFEAGERAGNRTGKDYSRSWLQCGRSGYNEPSTGKATGNTIHVKKPAKWLGSSEQIFGEMALTVQCSAFLTSLRRGVHIEELA